jgi:hypothetical protein
MNISDFNSLSHFTGRRSGSTKKSDSSSGKKIIRKRKNYERFLLNEKKLRLSIQKKFIPKLKEHRNKRHKQIEGMSELQDIWKKARIKKIKRDYNKTEKYDTKSRYKVQFDKARKKRLLSMIKKKLFQLMIERYKEGDAIEVFENRFLDSMPYNGSKYKKWLLVKQAAKELYTTDIDKLKEGSSEDFSFMKNILKTVRKNVARVTCDAACRRKKEEEKERKRNCDKAKARYKTWKKYLGYVKYYANPPAKWLPRYKNWFETRRKKWQDKADNKKKWGDIYQKRCGEALPAAPVKKGAANAASTYKRKKVKKVTYSVPVHKGSTSKSSPGVPSWVPGVIKKHIKGFISSARRPFDKLKEAALSLYNKAKKKANELKGKATTAANTLANFPEEVKYQLSGVFNSLKSSVTNTVNSVTSGIKTKLNSLKNTVGNSINSVKSTITSIKNTISQKVSSVVNSAKGFVSGIAGGIKKAATSVISSVTGVLKKMKNSITSGLTKTWNTVSGALKKAGKKLSDTAKTVIKKIGKVAKSGFDFLKKAVKKVSSHMKKFVSKGWTWIKNTAKKAFKFFKKLLVKIWSWFKKIMTRLFGFLKALFGGKNVVAKIMKFLIKIILVLLGGIPGQLIARMKYLNGSLDKWWLLFPMLNVYPFSIVPTAMIVLNKVKQGVDDELPYDGFLRVIMLLGVSLPALQNLFDPTYLFPVYSIYVFASWFFIFSMRDRKKCKKSRGREDGWQLGKFLKSASIGSVAFVILKDVIELFGDGVPLIGFVIGKIGEIPLIGDMFMHSLGAASAYILVNMLNNTPRATRLPGPLSRVPRLIKGYCNDYPKKKGIHAALIGLGFLSIYFLATNTIESFKEILGKLL